MTFVLKSKRNLTPLSKESQRGFRPFYRHKLTLLKPSYINGFIIHQQNLLNHV